MPLKNFQLLRKVKPFLAPQLHRSKWQADLADLGESEQEVSPWPGLLEHCTCCHGAPFPGGPARPRGQPRAGLSMGPEVLSLCFLLWDSSEQSPPFWVAGALGVQELC